MGKLNIQNTQWLEPHGIASFLIQSTSMISHSFHPTLPREKRSSTMVTMKLPKMTQKNSKSGRWNNQTLSWLCSSSHTSQMKSFKMSISPKPDGHTNSRKEWTNSKKTSIISTKIEALNGNSKTNTPRRDIQTSRILKTPQKMVSHT